MSDVVPHQYLSVKLKVEPKTNQFKLLGQVGLNGVLGSLHGLPKQPNRSVSEAMAQESISSKCSNNVQVSAC